MTPIHATRRGATLIELLVVMAITAALGAMALMLLPSVANSDSTIKGTAEVQAACKIAQANAAAARHPRGVRLLTQGGTIAYEMQYLEAPPVMIADPQVLVGNRAGNPQGITGPCVRFAYDVDDGSKGTNPYGTIIGRHCYIDGLNPDQASQVTDGATLVLPTLGAFSRIKSALGAMAKNEVILEIYPDAQLGAAGLVGNPAPDIYRTFHFGIYGTPVPLIAEPTVLLPRNIGIDLSISYPPLQVAGQNYDIMFAPSGQLIATSSTAGNTGVTGNTAVFLWIRDTSKTDMDPISAPSTSPISPAPPAAPGPSRWSYGAWQFDPAKFRKGGEQQIVGIRNGFVGAGPVLWPDMGTGTYGGQDPYSMARKQLN